MLLKLIDENNFDASTIFNVDESGFSMVPKTCQKILDGAFTIHSLQCAQ